MADVPLDFQPSHRMIAMDIVLKKYDIIFFCIIFFREKVPNIFESPIISKVRFLVCNKNIWFDFADKEKVGRR